MQMRYLYHIPPFLVLQQIQKHPLWRVFYLALHVSITSKQTTPLRSDLVHFMPKREALRITDLLNEDA
jgi:hypothetical protein